MDSQYSKNEFFSKERRIEENRNRLKELYEQYKKTENYYPLFLAYITAFGFYYFDFIAALINFPHTWYFTAITILTAVVLLYVLVLIWNFFKSVEWHQDYLPQGIYEEFPTEIIKDIPELKGNDDLLREELYDRYIKDLEDFVEKDLDIYIKKRNRLKKVWLPMLLSLFLYSINITVYKSLSDTFLKKEPQKVIIMSPRKIVTNENKRSISDSAENKKSQKSGIKANIKQKVKITPKTNTSKNSDPKK